MSGWLLHIVPLQELLGVLIRDARLARRLLLPLIVASLDVLHASVIADLELFVHEDGVYQLFLKLLRAPSNLMVSGGELRLQLRDALRLQTEAPEELLIKGVI